MKKELVKKASGWNDDEPIKIKKKSTVERKVYISIFLIVFILIIASWSAFSVTRTISPTQDTVSTFIRNSNGKYWSATASNLQTAIWDLNGTGGTVQLPIGIFAVGYQIEMENNTILNGEGRGTILRADNSLGNPNVINVEYGTSDVIISNLCIDGNVANRVDGGEDSYQANIHVSGTNVLVENCFLYNSTRHTVYFHNSSDCIIKSCFIERSGDHSIYVRNNATKIQVLGNRIKDSGRAGIRFGPSTFYCLADGNIVNTTGLNTTDPGLHAYDMGGSGTRCHNHTFSNNIVINAGNYGIYDACTSMPSHNLYIGNKICSANNGGIYIFGDCATVVGNVVYDTVTTTGDGIQVAGDLCIITDNLIDAVFREGIEIIGDRNIVQSNIIDNAGTRGIYLSGNDNIVSYNIVTSCTGYSISDDGNNNWFSHNDINNTGIGVNFAGDGTVILYNKGYKNNSLFPYYAQATPPTLPANTTAWWYNTTGNWLYQVAKSYGTQYYLNMSTTH